MAFPPLKNILIINPHGIGDVLFTTPVISNLKRAHPQARITYIANRRAADVLKGNPKVDEILYYERDEFIAVYKKNVFAFWAKWLGFVNDIRTRQFDAVFDFSLNPAFGFVCRLCRIPLRVGYNYKKRGRFLTHSLPLKGFEGRHVAEYYLDLLGLAGISAQERAMEFPIGVDADMEAKAWIASQGIPTGKPLIAVIPGGGASWGTQAARKRWPAGKYAEFVDKMIAQYPVVVILLGDRKDAPLCQDIARQVHHPIYSAAGQTSLVQMAALIKQCRLAVVNDGGPLHVAVAAGTPTVSVFGPVDSAVYGPYPRDGHDRVTLGLACQPCYRNFRAADCEHISCLQDLPVERVYQHVERYLKV